MNLPMNTFPLERPANDPSPPASDTYTCPACAHVVPVGSPCACGDGSHPSAGYTDWPPLDHDVELIAPPERFACEGWWIPFAFTALALAMIAFGIWGEWQMITGG